MEITGTYGSNRTPCTIFVSELTTGESWYVVEGGSVVNLTYDQLYDGIDVETIADLDCFTAQEGIYSVEQLEEEIEK